MSGTGVHPTAYVKEGARIAADVHVGAYAVIGSHVEIGKGCRILPHAVVVGNTIVGDQTEVHSHAVIGGTPQDLKYQGGDTRR